MIRRPPRPPIKMMQPMALDLANSVTLLTKPAAWIVHIIVYVHDFASTKIYSNSNADLFQTFNSLHIHSKK